MTTAAIPARGRGSARVQATLPRKIVATPNTGGSPDQNAGTVTSPSTPKPTPHQAALGGLRAARRTNTPKTSAAATSATAKPISRFTQWIASSVNTPRTLRAVEITTATAAAPST